VGVGKVWGGSMSEAAPIYHTGKRGKYHAQKVTDNGITFDSKAEYRRYLELKMLEQAGVISNLVVHPVYELQPAFRRGGEKIRPITYEGDFEYYEGDKQIVEDVKGGKVTQTEAFRVKRKMFLYHYPDVEFRVVEK
jgi:hypothetical protein